MFKNHLCKIKAKNMLTKHEKRAIIDKHSNERARKQRVGKRA